jgi:hypothetical protein
VGNYQWTDLPDRARQAIEQETGPVINADPPSAGRCSDFTATLHTQTGLVFCKGSTTASKAAWMPRNEVAVAPFLPSSAPGLLWQVEEAGWLFLGFEHVAGRHANLSPGSADLVDVANAVIEMNTALTPCPPVTVRTLTDQWRYLRPWQQLQQQPPAALNAWTRTNLDRFCDIGAWATELVAGDSLIHTDLHDSNILISGGRAHVIDWAWARRGASWVDTGFLIIRLINAGHAPDEAEHWAASIPAWRAASDTAQSAFAVGVLGLWEWLEHSDPMSHRSRLTNAARIWAQHRIRVAAPAGR